MRLQIKLDPSVNSTGLRKFWCETDDANTTIEAFLEYIVSCLGSSLADGGQGLYAQVNETTLKNAAKLQDVVKHNDVIVLKRKELITSTLVLSKTIYNMVECSQMEPDATVEWLDDATIPLYLPYIPTNVEDYRTLAPLDFIYITYQGLEPPSYSPEIISTFAFVHEVDQDTDTLRIRRRFHHRSQQHQLQKKNGNPFNPDEPPSYDRGVAAGGIIKCIKYGVVSKLWLECEIFDIYPVPDILDDASSGVSSSSNADTLVM